MATELPSVPIVAITLKMRSNIEIPLFEFDPCFEDSFFDASPVSGGPVFMGEDIFFILGLPALKL